MFDRPFDAVARGAAAFVAGVDFYDHIQHDYAIRHIRAQRGEYEYRTIVPRGTPYPTTSPVCRLTVKATYQGQTSLGLAIFEMGEGHHAGRGTVRSEHRRCGGASSRGIRQHRAGLRPLGRGAARPRRPG